MPSISKTKRRAVAVLEVMWDWRAMTSSAGYRERAPGYYRINSENLTGSRLYAWLGKQGEYFDELLVTNACPELVSSAKERGTPDAEWLAGNLKDLEPFQLLLVCGRVAQNTYCIPNRSENPCRIIELPHPAARQWSRKTLETAGRFIREGTIDLELYFDSGRLLARNLIPF